MKDAIIVALLVLAFAGAVTCQLALVIGLARRSPRSRAAVALVVPPLAPYWGIREGMSVRAYVWLACVALYGVTRVIALY